MCEQHDGSVAETLTNKLESNMHMHAGSKWTLKKPSQFVTGPAKRDQVGTKYIISQNGTYLEFCVQYLFSVSCRMLLMQLLIDCKKFTYIALADH